MAVLGISEISNLLITDTIESSSINDGALIVNGGAAVKLNLNVGGTLNANTYSNLPVATINSQLPGVTILYDQAGPQVNGAVTPHALQTAIASVSLKSWRQSITTTAAGQASITIPNYKSYMQVLAFINGLALSDGSNGSMQEYTVSDTGVVTTTASLLSGQDFMVIAFYTNDSSYMPPETPTITTPNLSLIRIGSTIVGTISNVMGGATYIYKIGSEPTSQSDGTVIVNNSFTIQNDSSMTIYVKGYMTGYNPSASISSTVEAKPKVATPTISYDAAMTTVTLNCSTAGAEIRYSINDSNPLGSGGHIYTAPFTISSTSTIYAIGVLENYIDSDVTSQLCEVAVKQKVATPVIEII